ncbi:hypothetical protein N5U14_05935 [Aliarcobacter butzleri]|uniref:hypothetical protein n=1 Tax=Aliarcobacter butzleri TaxID=28197 RepID=UPI0021B4626C|nr:hypothetical protein [Aliarcobacter butzleri]MCT7610379.1 hypothetical protein [Aliarcobacter butzleri]
MNKISEYFGESLGIIYNGLFYISLILIITVISFILGAIYSNYKIDNNIVMQMLPALGITLSALLASTSLMKSIQNTNKIEKKKGEKEEKELKNRVKFYLTLIKSLKKVLEDEINIEKIDFNAMVFNEINFIKELIIKDSKVLSVLDNIHSANIVIVLSSLSNIYIQKPKEIDISNLNEVAEEAIYKENLIAAQKYKLDKLNEYINNLENFIKN